MNRDNVSKVEICLKDRERDYLIFKRYKSELFGMAAIISAI